MSKPPKNSKTQLNPLVPTSVVQRLDELAAVYDDSQYHVLNIALEYGARHFKKAHEEYHALRKDQYQDADDKPTKDDPKIINLAAPGGT